MDERIGDFPDLTALDAEVAIELYPETFPVRWDLCGATADFFATYFSRLPRCGGDDDDILRAEVENAISYVLNEAVENAVKFQRGGTITVRVGVHEGALVFVVGNWIARATADALRPRLRELIEGDAQEMLLRRVEENAANPAAGVSGLGFLTMITDYEAQLGWRISAPEEQAERVFFRTMARLPIHRT
ncbi:MAG: hypothetical protein H6711_18255 [Myxococcales bacterium]|nr:hypothetical protein [Myxococcales bacterium]